MTRLQKYVMTSLLCSMSLYVVGYSINNTRKDSTITDFLPQQQGTVVIDNLNIREYQKSIPIHEVQAGHVVFGEKDKTVQMNDFTMRFGQESGEQGSIKAKKTIYNVSSKDATIQGNVKYVSQKGGELTCDLLRWNLDNGQIHVPGKFYVTFKHGVSQGNNLITNSKLDNVSITNAEGTIR